MENSRTPEVYLEDLSAGDNSKASCFNDIIETKREIKNKSYQQELSESTHHFNDEKKENDEDEKVKKGTLFQNISTEAEFVKTVEQQKTRSGELEISEQKNCTVGNQTDLNTCPADSKLSSSVMDHADTSKSELIKDDALLCKKINDKCCNNSKSLDKARKFGVNPIQIGILIDKKDFLDHCNMVKNGLKKSYRKTRHSSLSKQGTALEEQSNSISLKTTHLAKNTISNTEADSTSKSSSSDKQVIQATSSSDLSRQLSSTTGTTVSRQTVYRRLGHIGLYARRPVRCVPLTATHCCSRLTWSREHAMWTPQQWSCVMFSDESRFNLQSDSRRTLIWRAPGTRYHQENTIERHCYGGAGWLARLGRNYSWFQN
ncbi:HTH_Tnp_Tc3_2 domain-containing protein [Trichonephila clavipes]|nr:HTH_Tnp_Tc3_2 domain-containing protein [Trichonephila clavipes]